MALFLNKLIYRSNKSKTKYLTKKGAKIGENLRLHIPVNNFGSEPWLISIGDDVLISYDVNFVTHDGAVSVLNNLNFFSKRNDLLGKIIIGNNVFIGCKSIILKGAIIGNNVIIGAGSVVNNKLESNYVYAGVPAKKICSIEEYFNKHKENFTETVGLKSNQKYKYFKDRGLL